MIYLNTDRLRVEICEPHEMPNNTFRFDRSGFISEVTLDGHSRFCAEEPNNLSHPSSGGRGFCSEIQCDASTEAAVGGYFPKFGIGLFKKKEQEPYCFYKKYDAELFPVSVKHTETTAEFRTEAIACMGYALEENRKIEVNDNRMKLTACLTNVGTKAVHIREYCHNFISICGMALGDAYVLELPDARDIPIGLLKSYVGTDNYIGTEKGLQVSRYSDEPAMLFLLKEKINCDRVFRWKLSNRAAGVYVSCEEDFVPSELNLWCVDHIVSPEVFYETDLKPGDTACWSRNYTFEHIEKNS